MKNYKSFAFAALLLSLISCSLEEDTSSLSTQSDFFRTYSECQSVVNGCYIPIKSIYTYQFMVATECVTDILFDTGSVADARLEITPANPGMGSTVWRQGYLGVQRCNLAVQGITQAYEDDILDTDEYNQLICESKTLRGLYYWILTSFFGDVPFYFDAVTDNEILDEIAQLPRMDAVATRDSLIVDLLSVAPYDSQTRTSDNDEDRLGAACAYMLVAKMAMWNEEWDVAIDAIGKIEDIYGEFTQYDYEENVMFRYKNTPESIFEVQHTYTAGGLTYYSNVACICMPYPHTSGTAIYDGVEIDFIGSEATVWTPMRPNVTFCNGIQTKASGDIRATVNMAWEYNGQTFNSVSTRPWPGPKFWCEDMRTTADGNNYKVFRYADALLMKSECYCELEDYDSSVEYLNYTRERAGLGSYTFRTEARLREEIRNERARELFGEFQRKFDLVRWGIWYDAVTSNSDYARLQLNTSTSTIKPCHRYYPIPDTQVVLSNYNLDNEEYNSYGL